MPGYLIIMFRKVTAFQSAVVIPPCAAARTENGKYVHAQQSMPRAPRGKKEGEMQQHTHHITTRGERRTDKEL